VAPLIIDVLLGVIRVLSVVSPGAPLLPRAGGRREATVVGHGRQCDSGAKGWRRGPAGIAAGLRLTSPRPIDSPRRNSPPPIR